MKTLLAIATIGFASQTALAQPAPAEPPPPEPEAQDPVAPAPPPDDGAEQPQEPVEVGLTAADVSNAPRPGEEHGRVDPIDTGDGAGRILGRVILWVPRIPVEIVMQPIRGALYLQEKYNVADKIASVFVSEDGKVGVYPTALVETGFGLNVGIRAFFRDLLGKNEKLSLRGGFGGRQNRYAEIDLDTGRRVSDPVAFGITARYENRDRDRFFGYGNGEEVDLPAMPIDPLTDDRAVRTRFAMDIWRIVPRITVKLPHYFQVQLEGGFVHKEFGNSTISNAGNDVPILDAYNVSGNALPGFVRGTEYFYTEAQIAYDSRRPADEYDSPGIRGSGGLAMGFLGRQMGRLEGEPSFYRAGFDLQRYIRLTKGPRVLELRAYAEMVTGDRDQVPFSELPRLGGQDVLRGYLGDRFRDKVATVGQIGYVWYIGRTLAGTIFADVGKVAPSVSDLDFEKLRVGYGIALEAYSAAGMLVRAEVASSIDGGVFAYLSFNPVFQARSRVERY